MAAITLQGSSFLTAAGNKTVTATPAIGNLIVIICANSGRTTGQFPVVTDNNSSGTYSRIPIVDCVKNASADSMWAFVRNTLIPAASSTIYTMTQSGDSGGGLVVYTVTLMGYTGGAAVRQGGIQNNQAAAGTPAPVLPVACLTNNPTIGAIFNASNTAAMTPPASWTEDPTPDLGYNTPASGIEVVRRDSGFTGTTVTWGGTSASAFCSLILELNTTIPFDRVMQSRQPF